jgi:hypothetical protein
MGTRYTGSILIAAGLCILCGCNHKKPVTDRPAKPRQQQKSVRPDSLPDVNDKPQGKTAKPVSFNENLAGFFARYVNDNGMVDYKTLRPKRLELIELLREFDRLSVKEYDSWSEKEKIAFWINAYNLCTIKVVIDNYPIKASRYMLLFYPASSIRQVSKPWTGYTFEIMQVKYTLREIEQLIVLKQFNEPRVCFALSYASIDGPRLRNEPYTGPKLEKQLDEQVKNFISNERGFNINRRKSDVYLSAIFKWHAEALTKKFGTDRKFTDQSPDIRTALNFISGYIPRRDVDYLERKNYSVEYLKFDWTLNEQ